jgi:hypothetical protein
LLRLKKNAVSEKKKIPADGFLRYNNSADNRKFQNVIEFQRSGFLNL